MQYSFERSWFDSPAKHSIDRHRTQSAALGNALQVSAARRNTMHYQRGRHVANEHRVRPAMPSSAVQLGRVRELLRRMAEKCGIECNWGNTGQ